MSKPMSRLNGRACVATLSLLVATVTTISVLLPWQGSVYPSTTTAAPSSTTAAPSSTTTAPPSTTSTYDATIAWHRAGPSAGVAASEAYAATAAGGATVVVSWDPAPSLSGYYTLQRQHKAATTSTWGSWGTRSSSLTGTSYTETGLGVGNDYRWRVKKGSGSYVTSNTIRTLFQGDVDGDGRRQIGSIAFDESTCVCTGDVLYVLCRASQADGGLGCQSANTTKDKRADLNGNGRVDVTVPDGQSDAEILQGLMNP